MKRIRLHRLLDEFRAFLADELPDVSRELERRYIPPKNESAMPTAAPVMGANENAV